MSIGVRDLGQCLGYFWIKAKTPGYLLGYFWVTWVTWELSKTPGHTYESGSTCGGETLYHCRLGIFETCWDFQKSSNLKYLPIGSLVKFAPGKAMQSSRDPRACGT